jgi:hypothetical protein
MTDEQPEVESTDPEDIEVVAHSEEEDEELEAGTCFFNNSSQL